MVTGRNILILTWTVATQDIEEDEELFAVSRNLVLTTATTDYLPALSLPNPDTWLPLIIVTVQQLLNKGSSKWHPYFQVLPPKFDTLMYWTETELAELQASAVTRRIGKASADKSFREEAWDFMMADLEFFDVEGEEEAEWEEHAVHMCHYAGSLIMAYAFDIDRDEADAQPNGNMADIEDLQSDDEENPLKGLVPFADMLNADGDRNNARLFQEGSHLIMKAIKPIKAGEECFNDYGPLPRSELLRMYGYVTDNYKQYDVVEFEHDLLENVAGNKAKSKEWQKKKEQLDEIGVLDDGYNFPCPEPNDDLEAVLPGELHMVIRGLCSNPQVQKKAPITIEEAALLSTIVTKKLSEYPTSLEEDQTLLATSLASSNAPEGVSQRRYHMAIEVRTGEKEILHQILELCQTHIERLTSEKKRKPDDAKKSRTNKNKKTKR